MIYGYIRVSTDQQTLENQKYQIQKFCNANKIKVGIWVEEVISSRKPLHERKLGELLKKIKKGDILIANEISRLGRNMLEVMGILQTCLEKDCQIWTLKENYRLGADIQSKVLAFAFSLAGEIERQMISQRTRDSLNRLKSEGVKLGRPKGKQSKKLIKSHDKIAKLLQKKIPKAEIARIIGCNWMTLHRYIQDNLDLR